MGCQMGERCQSPAVSEEGHLAFRVSKRRRDFSNADSHLHRKKNNYAKLQGTGLCPFLCLQLISVTAQKSLLGSLEGLAGLGEAAIWSACPSPRRGQAAWEQRGQSPPCWGGMK